MSQNSSKHPGRVGRILQNPVAHTVAYIVWVFAVFMLANIMIAATLQVLVALGVSFAHVDRTLLVMVVSALTYALAIILTIGVPLIVRRERSTRQELGLSRAPAWIDVIAAPAGFIVYFIVTVVLAVAATYFLPFYDATQVQDVGISGLSDYGDYLLAFFTLVVLAPLAEELLFRGYLYGKLRSAMPAWVAIVLTAGVFGYAHGHWNVGIDTFALGLVLATLREYTGNIWASVLVHMLKNGLAFYLLFIN